MSSARSPDLRLDLVTDRRLTGALQLWLVLVVLTVWQAELPAAVLALVTLVVLFLGLPVVASQRFAGGGRGPRVLLWSSAGTWRCELADGSSEELELSPESRVFPGGALLVFQQGRCVQWLLLLRSRPRGELLRRLCGRLGLERVTRRESARPAPGSGSRPAGRRGAPEGGGGA